MRRHIIIAFTLVACILILTPHLFAAGTTTTGSSANDFIDIYNKFVDWTAGSLGKAIALAMFLLGLGVGVMRQSPLLSVSGVIAGFIMAKALSKMKHGKPRGYLFHYLYWHGVIGNLSNEDKEIS